SAHICLINVTPTTQIYTLSLHDALPISNTSIPTITRYMSSILFTTGSISSKSRNRIGANILTITAGTMWARFSKVLLSARTSSRSEEHTSELQSRENLVCRLLLEKKNKK